MIDPMCKRFTSFPSMINHTSALFIRYFLYKINSNYFSQAMFDDDDYYYYYYYPRFSNRTVVYTHLPVIYVYT